MRASDISQAENSESCWTKDSDEVEDMATQERDNRNVPEIYVVNGLIVVHIAFEAPTKVNRERHSVTSCAPGRVHLNNSLYVAPLPAISTSSPGSVNSADLPDTLQ